MSSFDNRHVYPDDTNDTDNLSANSTNATQSDLPGAGRTLGNLYGNLGAKLETALNSLASKVGKRPTNVSLDHVDTSSVISPNDTRSDIPGAGRTLGRLYGKLGTNLEIASNYLVNKKEMGPIAAARRIRRRERERIDSQSRPNQEYTSDEAMRQRKDTKKLISYARYISISSVYLVIHFNNPLHRSKTESTRKQALDSIVDLSLGCDDLLIEILRASNAPQVLIQQEAYIWDFCDVSTRISSRLALTCVREDKLRKFAQSYQHNRLDGSAPEYFNLLKAFIQYVCSSILYIYIVTEIE